MGCAERRQLKWKLSSFKRHTENCIFLQTKVQHATRVNTLKAQTNHVH